MTAGSERGKREPRSDQGRRFQINPGPLRRVPARQAEEAWDRCEAITGPGWRCLRDAKWTYNGDRLCEQHMRSRDAKAHGAIKPERIGL